MIRSRNVPLNNIWEKQKQNKKESTKFTFYTKFMLFFLRMSKYSVTHEHYFKHWQPQIFALFSICNQGSTHLQPK